MRIYIPTLGRVTRQFTYNDLAPSQKKNAVLVVSPSEERAHADAGYPVLVCPKKGIGHVRQWILDQHDIAKHGRTLIMLDDDLGFSVRREDEPTRFRVPTDAEKVQGFREVEKLCGKLAMVGIRHREMAQDAPIVAYCTRLLRALAFNVPLFRASGVRFDRCTVMEDFDVMLQLLRGGYANAAYSWLIQNQAGSGREGGCSTYRTMDVQAASAAKLAKLHPEFVKLVQKETKGAWGGGVRTDVQIAWKKAFASSGKELPK